ncbi:CGGC domain-containing protein [uncultured Ilyobacter sp.]|uniref:CGGC domain-containing protein n=1 Tax=uncultured Ilyobacter sp. TaxID=544433 RepID=UPI002AA6E7E2|nr:CGGC domain-containing protein [uncultured Ilyobacter sp.]
MDIKLAAIIQCEKAKNRCSGYACTDSFYKKINSFNDYSSETQYISFTCGGCNGKGVGLKINNLVRRMPKLADIKNSEIAVHLSSCIVLDNRHSDRCPNVDYMKSIIKKAGIKTIIEGTYISKTAQKKREAGVYKKYTQ